MPFFMLYFHFAFQPFRHKDVFFNLLLRAPLCPFVRHLKAGIIITFSRFSVQLDGE